MIATISTEKVKSNIELEIWNSFEFGSIDQELENFCSVQKTSNDSIYAGNSSGGLSCTACGTCCSSCNTSVTGCK